MKLIKRKIIKNNCDSNFSPQAIEIYTKHWPVTATWDKSSFNYAYINSSGDTVPFFWQAFGDSTLLLSGFNKIENSKTLFNIYPNPTHSVFYIPFTLTESGRVMITLHDILGKQIKLLYDQPTHHGKHFFNFDIGNKINTGFYIIRFAFNDRYSYKPIVLIN